MTSENQVGNPKGLTPMTPGNFEWCNPEVSDELDDEPESNKLNSMESILIYEKETNASSHAPSKTEPAKAKSDDQKGKLKKKKV
jgi:hypothetical protein